MKKYMSTRVWVVLIVLVLALFAIAPNPWASGVQVKSVDPASDVAQNGLAVGDIIVSISDEEMSTEQDVVDALAEFEYAEQEITIETDEEEVTYTVTNDFGFVLDENLTVLSEEDLGLTEGSMLLKINGEEIVDYELYEEIYDTLIPKQTVKIQTDSLLIAYVSREVPYFTVGEASTSNLVFGLDFTGGTRVLLEPVSDEEITDDDIDLLIEVLSNRLNVYGLSDIKIRSAEDWEGNQYVLVELAGVTEDEVQDLISQQGQFEAYVGEVLVFEGGEEDIPYVCRNDGSCSGVQSCSVSGGVNVCTFQFTITLSQDAADKMAAATENLEVVYSENGGAYLNETIDFYLVGELVDSLNIAESLKGQSTTSVAISGPGYGETQNAAIEDAMSSMNTLQTILITGSLPFDIEIAKLDSVSPVLGESFIENVLWVGLFALLAVVVVVYIRYRKVKVLIPMVATLLSELFLILGFAAIVSWNLDMAAMAGILAAIGTGVDDQIVIIDEAVRGERFSNWKKRLKRAFFIIFVAYATTVAAMLPLWNAGAGLIRGFAVTTIVGVTIGVFLTRPAFASIIEKMGLD